MAAVPKIRISSGRRDRRRAQTFPSPRLHNQIHCECGELVLPYHVCQKCGRYRGRKVMEVEEN